MNNTLIAGLSLSALLLGPQTLDAQELPKWELGLGILPSSFPDYRGSKHQRTYVLPVPYAVYRGENVKLDRQGVKGRLFESYRIKLNLSGFASVPVNSDDNTQRQGMPDLDPIVEFGPVADLLLHEQDNKARWRLRLPLRAVIATDLRSAQYAGWRFNPHLNYHIPNLIDHWSLGLNAGPLFATRAYHDYYYSVAPTYATAQRPAYEADAGYSGSAVFASLSKHTRRFWFGGYLRYDTLKGAAFSDSPLVETEQVWSGGLGFAWKFAFSKETVSNPIEDE